MAVSWVSVEVFVDERDDELVAASCSGPTRHCPR